MPEATVVADLRRARKTRDQLSLLNDYARRAGLRPIALRSFESTVDALNGASHGRSAGGEPPTWVRQTRKLVIAVQGSDTEMATYPEVQIADLQAVYERWPGTAEEKTVLAALILRVRIERAAARVPQTIIAGKPDINMIEHRCERSTVRWTHTRRSAGAARSKPRPGPTR